MNYFHRNSSFSLSPLKKEKHHRFFDDSMINITSKKLNLEREKEILSNEKERDNSSIQDENPRRPGNPVLLGPANKCLD